ncbi:glycyl-radical enzyme activating protein [Lacrimispora sp.]|uniref:glycyl-radical enzyme activating protein n=1 Tax=Lacrimispora sp. TaxID=2719234 RepID=UPI0028A9D81E|nr:glycyl-radical enzyme activating protein [Lacrimispora sp.]
MENKAVQGTIFNIQRFSIHDGPGIRTLIFMKGCPLRCRWCSNPEGLTSGISILSNIKLCIGCGLCSQFCKFDAILKQEDGSYQIDRDKCTGCQMCTKVCPSNSKTVSGEVKSVEEIIRIVEKDRSFYKHSGGGITVGGGEMLAQPDFTFEILRRCRENGMDTAVETSGCGSCSWLLKIADQCNTIHFDLKAIDYDLHKELTGVGNTMILNNLKVLSEHLWNKEEKERSQLIIRLPLIIGYNTHKEEIEKVADFILSELKYYSLTEVLAFHNFGEKKYQELGMTYEFMNHPNSTVEDLKEQITILKESGLRLKIPKW